MAATCLARCNALYIWFFPIVSDGLSNVCTSSVCAYVHNHRRTDGWTAHDTLASPFIPQLQRKARSLPGSGCRTHRYDPRDCGLRKTRTRRVSCQVHGCVSWMRMYLKAKLLKKKAGRNVECLPRCDIPVESMSPERHSCICIIHVPISADTPRMR